jgi:hypothetical protein
VGVAPAKAHPEQLRVGQSDADEVRQQSLHVLLLQGTSLQILPREKDVRAVRLLREERAPRRNLCCAAQPVPGVHAQRTLQVRILRVFHGNFFQDFYTKLGIFWKIK